jgi:serine/threonine-protein kinase HipA
MSLAGVQSKLAVAVDDAGRICIPTEGSPSTHILKPDSQRLWGGVQNEAFCLTLARQLNIPVPRVTTGKAGKRSFLLVERYDRMKVGEQWRRVHQEDFCQALGKPPAAKYETNQTGVKGPTLADMFDLTRRHMGPLDVIRLLDMVAFNVIACNTDAHAKNYAIMINASGASLAPLYDVMCADVWDSVTRNLAQKIAGKNRGDHLMRRHWRRFAEQCGLNPRAVIARVAELTRLTLAAATAAASEVAAMPAGDHAILDQAKRAVERRARSLQLQLRDTSDEPDEDEQETEITSSTTPRSAASRRG